jgi:hypothetical protein
LPWRGSCVLTNYPLYFDPAEILIGFAWDGGDRD